MNQNEMERRFAEIDSREPEEPTAEDLAAIRAAQEDTEAPMSLEDFKQDLESCNGRISLRIPRSLHKKLKESGEYLDLEDGVLIHGGGWKKLVNEAVSKDEFKAGLKEVCGIKSVHDYYGMVEQTGCIYIECECGHLHASIFSDVIIRNMKDFSVCKNGETGSIQVLSTLPESYPGHSILTEDMGRVLGEDDCPCGRKGKYIEVIGRMKNAEVRGCSDTFERKS